jgi:hypothetical protein
MKYLHFLEAWLLSLFFRPKKDLDKIKLVITNLQAKLIDIAKIENKVIAITELIKEISQVEDSGEFDKTIKLLKSKNYGQLGFEINLLLNIQKKIGLAGYSCDFNRSKRGEPVTSDKIYLGGGNSGIWVKSAHYWLKKQKLYQTYLEDDVSSELGTIWDCIHRQAANFVDNYIARLSSRLEEFKKGSQ